MFDRVRQLFTKPKPPLSDESRDFITQLAASDIWILAVGLRGCPATPSLTDPAGLDLITAHRIDVSAIGDDDSVLPFNFDRGGTQALPFFSSAERARQFAAATALSASITVFQPTVCWLDSSRRPKTRCSSSFSTQALRKNGS